MRRVAIVSAMGLLAVTMLASPSQAVLGGFEADDGNLVNDGDTDWNDFDEWWNKIVPHNQTLNAADDETPVAGFEQLTWVQDRTGNPDDIFGGGVKQDHECPATKTGSLGGGNSKFDLDRIYLTHTVHDGDDFLFLAWVRVPQNSTTASAHVAFEFNQGSEMCNGLVERTAGDKLIVYDFEGGSGTASFPSLKLLDWTTNPNHACEVANNSPPCWRFLSELDADNSEGRVNTVDIGTVHDAIADEDLGPVRFGEAGINISAIDGVDPCDFSGRVTGVSRSSGNSGTAQMKDKVGPAIFTLPDCVAETGLTTEIFIGDTATITGFDDTGDGDGTLTFSLYGPDDEDCSGSPVYETEIEDIDGAGPWSTEDGDNDDAYYIVPVDEPGEYRWVVEYSGDNRNTPSESLCGEEVVVVSYGLDEEE